MTKMAIAKLFVLHANEKSSNVEAGAGQAPPPTWEGTGEFQKNCRMGKMEYFGLIREELWGIWDFGWGQGGVETLFGRGCTPSAYPEVFGGVL